MRVITPTMTTDELADRWHVTSRTVRNIRARGELPTVYIGNLPRYLVEDVIAYEDRHRVRRTSDHTNQSAVDRFNDLDTRPATRWSDSDA